MAYAPVGREDQPAAVLCGTIDLDWMLQGLSAQYYGNGIQFYIVEQESGQFLLDSWHGSLGKMDDLKGRKAAKGYSREAFLEGFSQGESGLSVFASNSAGENFYVAYAPMIRHLFIPACFEKMLKENGGNSAKAWFYIPGSWWSRNTTTYLTASVITTI